MTTDKIIAAACEAAGHPPETDLPMQPNREMLAWLERFYAIAYRAGMERAAELCDAEDRPGTALYIRAHAKNQPESTHDISNV